MLGNLPEGHSLCIEQKIRVPKIENHSPLSAQNSDFIPLRICPKSLQVYVSIIPTMQLALNYKSL